MKSAVFSALLFLMLTTSIFGQLSKDDVKELLILQGESSGAELWRETDRIYEGYLEVTSGRIPTLATAMSLSFGNGVAMGIHQSHTALYKETDWLPGFMQDWMDQRYLSDGVYTLTGQTNKVFREIDYISDRMAYHNWKRFYGNNWIFAYLSHTVVKNVTGHLVRHRTKTGSW